MGEWQDISTAPRDGTTVQLWHTTWKAPFSAKWDPENIKRIYPRRDLHWIEAGYAMAWPDEAFSHWQPLPAPPQEPGDG